jgi:hypothetical protein
MLLNETEYRWLELDLNKRKLREYQRVMEKVENIQEVA